MDNPTWVGKPRFKQLYQDPVQWMPWLLARCRRLRCVCSFLGDLNVVSKLLQMAGPKAMDLDDVRVQFDMLFEKYPGTAHYLLADVESCCEVAERE